MIPMILLENNAGTHQSGPRGRRRRGGDNAAHTEPPRWERLTDGTALFTAWPGREQHGEHAGGRAEGGAIHKIIRLVNSLSVTQDARFLSTLRRCRVKNNSNQCHKILMEVKRNKTEKLHLGSASTVANAQSWKEEVFGLVVLLWYLAFASYWKYIFDRVPQVKCSPGPNWMFQWDGPGLTSRTS